MSTTLRVLLLLGSLLSFFWILRKIRKSQVALKDAVAWVFIAMVLVFMGVFPNVITQAAIALGVVSPVNFVFLCVITVLLLRVFGLSIKVSQLECKLQSFVQNQAIINQENEKRSNS